MLNLFFNRNERVCVLIIKYPHLTVLSSVKSNSVFPAWVKRAWIFRSDFPVMLMNFIALFGSIWITLFRIIRLFFYCRYLLLLNLPLKFLILLLLHLSFNLLDNLNCSWERLIINLDSVKVIFILLKMRQLFSLFV